MSTKASVDVGQAARPHAAGSFSWRFWLGAVAVLSATVSAVAFMTLFTTSVQMSKAIVYGPPNPLVTIYLNIPEISAVAGVLALVLALIATLGTPRAVALEAWASVVATILFFLVAFAVSSLTFALGLSSQSGPENAPTGFSVFLALTPPAVSLVVLLVGTVAFLLRLRLLAEQRWAMGAFIVGAVITSFWLISQLLLSFGGD